MKNAVENKRCAELIWVWLMEILTIFSRSTDESPNIHD